MSIESFGVKVGDIYNDCDELGFYIVMSICETSLNAKVMYMSDNSVYSYYLNQLDHGSVRFSLNKDTKTYACS